MAGNFFGSGDKTQQAFDQRIGVSEDGVLVQPGGFIFNPGRASSNDALAAGPVSTEVSPLVIGAAAVVLIVAVVAINWKK